MKNKKSIFEREYPYMFIVDVESVGYRSIRSGYKHTNFGVGTLIAPNLVLTCAHNIYFFLDKIE